MISLDSPEVKQALEDVEKMNTDSQWATLYIFDGSFEIGITIDYGTIHTNGMKERAIGTKRYSLNHRNSKVVIDNFVHL